MAQSRIGGKVSSRREFLRRSGGALAAAALAGGLDVPRTYAGEQNTIKIALVGCGGRGTGAAAEALQHQGPDQALGHGRLLPAPPRRAACKQLSRQFAKQVEVPARAAVHRYRRYGRRSSGRAGRFGALGHTARLPADARGICGRGDATYSWRNRSPLTPPACTACSGRVKPRGGEESQDRRRPDVPPQPAAGGGDRADSRGR